MKNIFSIKGKKILLGISGSIAAYKAASLVRLFIKAEAEVKVVMTEDAAKFITPLTISTLSKNPVLSNVSSEEGWNNHVEIGLWADVMIIAPATANTLAKLANGICDNMICATYLSAKCPVFVAPAMDVDMWQHPSTQSNIRKLQSYNNRIIPVGVGELASGLVGEGRMAEPEDILRFLSDFFLEKADFQGKEVLVTAGPTYEPIDPVRFVGNRSSGKMGVAIAEELAERGAKVNLVLGPSRLDVSHPNINLFRVQTAQEMYEASTNVFSDCDVAVMAAAVADYRPAEVANVKIKKKSDDMSIHLEKTQDIAASLGQVKNEKQILVGFALETNNEAANAQGKLERKNLDFIVLNSLQDKGAGFNHDTNK
ncbi:MAG: bifunctional phosphopantothenoylcysteine decarboxylase/phosphopantothenate--cysteine ligase CoaBC, partial [Saprospiraceae bacterium]